MAVILEGPQTILSCDNSHLASLERSEALTNIILVIIHYIFVLEMLETAAMLSVIEKYKFRQANVFISFPYGSSSYLKNFPG